LPKQTSEKAIAELAEKIRVALGTNLSSLVLYGSHVRGETHARSDINLFILVRDSDPNQLVGLHRALLPVAKKGTVAPVIMSEDEFRASQDTFALEFSEMAALHRVLAGRDPFEDFEPRWDGLRTQLERELRVKMIQLYRHWMVSGEKPATLRALLHTSFSSFLSLLRGIVALERKQIASIPPETLTNEIAAKCGLDAALWRRFYEVSRKNVQVPAEEMRTLFRSYLTEIRKLTAYIDRFKT
jgi:predicted nucleotidyltransferase